MGQQSFQAGVVAVEVVEDAGRVQMTQRDLGHHLRDLFQRAGAAWERDKGASPSLYHPGLALGHVLATMSLVRPSYCTSESMKNSA